MPKGARQKSRISHGNRQLVSMLLLRQDGKCFYCDNAIWIHADHGKETHRKATLDHKTPLALGGEPYGDNVVAACRLCNGCKGPLDAETYMRVRNDHAQRKALIRDIDARLAKQTDADRRRVFVQAKKAKGESIAQLQISLQSVVREYRRQLYGSVVIERVKNKNGY